MMPASQNTPSPSPSTLFLPLGRRSRRTSLSSVSSPSQVDKETLSNALDQIHSSASQSDSLTTFNDFSSPPSASPSGDVRSSPDATPSALSGLYSKFRGVVAGTANTGSKEKPGSIDDVVASRPQVPETFTPKTLNATARSSSSNLQSPVSVTLPSNTTLSPRGLSEASIKTSIGIKDLPQATNTGSVGSENVSAPFSDTSALSKGGNDVSEQASTTLARSGQQNPTKNHIYSKVEAPPLNPDKTISLSSKVSAHLPTHEDRNPLSSSSPAELAEESRSQREPDHSDNSDLLPSRTTSANAGPGAQRKETVLTDGSEKGVEGGKARTAYKEILEGSGEVPKQRPVSPIASGSSKPKAKSSDRHSSGHDQARETDSADVAFFSQRNQPTSRVSQSRLPGFKLSRSSSTDSGFSSPPESPSKATSQRNAPAAPAVGRHGNPTTTSKATSAVDNSKPNAETIQEFRTRVLSKDFWMRDENSKQCFLCGAAFSTWRRKHHCRTCGQIFDARCTVLIDGKVFGQNGTLRVCSPCQNLIEGTRNDSEGSMSDADANYHVMSTAVLSRQGGHATSGKVSDANGTPTMAIPTRRVVDSSNRRSAVIEIDSVDYLSRPGSSRSLRSSVIGRPHSSSIKRHSRQQYSRSMKSSVDERAPFHRAASDDAIKGSHLPAFHDDSIIDPELAAYMSDEEPSSDDEEMSIFATMNPGHGALNNNEHEKHALTSALATSRRGRSRFADKSNSAMSFNGRDLDDSVTGTGKVAHFQRMNRKKNLSLANVLYQRPSPRRSKSNLLAKGFGSSLADVLSSSPGSTVNVSTQSKSGFRMTRSASMRGATAPAVELNSASLNHVRKLLHQLLEDAKVANISGWEKSLIPILLRCTDDVTPDIRRGDDIDIRHYIKVKKIPGGKPGDTAYISGVVFRKNVALKTMPRSITYPRIVLIRSAIEYQRSQQHFMSLEPVIAQEKESLRNKVNRIQEFQPSLLLVQSNISGVALQYLDEAGIATAYNIKPSVIEAVGRCCRADVNSTIEMLSLNPTPVGQSASFDIKTYVHKDIPGQRRTYIYLSGCPKELGCTVVLRGANMSTLAKIKRITEFMVYVVYNLKLETCLMRDEYISIPATIETGSSEHQAGSHAKTPKAQTIDASGSQGKRSSMGLKIGSEVSSIKDPESSARSGAMKNGLQDKQNASATQASTNESIDESGLPDDIPMPTFYSDMVEKHQTKILSASPFVKFMQPYLLMRAREQERRLVYLKRLRDQNNYDPDFNEKETPQKFSLITPEMVHQSVHNAPQKVQEVLRAVHDAEYDKAMHNYQTQKRQWEAYISGNLNLFDPFAHQNIVVLFTLICTSTTVPCNGPELLALRFYDEHETESDDTFDPDCTLGQFVESLCLGAGQVCSANGCEKPMLNHHRQYVCGEGQVSISIESQPCKMRGLQDSILMWSWCKICQKDTQVMPMSESTWSYSFGKYLELSFWSSNLHLRANVCPHNLHRDHDRFFGFKDMAIRVQHTQISLLEIVVPRARITWKVDNDLKLKNELYTKIEERLNRFMGSVKGRLKTINIESVLPERTAACQVQIDNLTKRAADEHVSLIQNLQDLYMGSKYHEVIPLNRVVRNLQEKVVEWDTIFADFDADFFPSEKDIRRLATLQLRKIFLDRDDSISVPESGTIDSTSSHDLSQSEKNSRNASIEIAPKPTQISAEDARDMLTAVVEEHTGSHVAQNQTNEDSANTLMSRVTSVSPSSDASVSQAVEHLDLALVSHFPERTSSQAVPPESRPISPGDTRHINPMEMKPSKQFDSPSDTPLTTTQRRDPVTKSLSIQPSGIPTLSSGPLQRVGLLTTSPPLSRTKSQPVQRSRDPHTEIGRILSSNSPTPGNTSAPRRTEEPPKDSQGNDHRTTDRKMTERLGLTALKGPRKPGSHSLIPRSVGNKRKDSKVSSLARHFEQLSREFEKERLRERRRALLTRQSRVYPTASSKPIVEVFRTVKDAVRERDHSDEEVDPVPRQREKTRTKDWAVEDPIDRVSRDTASSEHQDATNTDVTTAENTEAEESNHPNSQTGSDAEGEASDVDHSILGDVRISDPSDPSKTIFPLDSPIDFKIDLPKHEKSSLMKMLTNFWAERSASGWTSLDYPLSATDHVFTDSDVIIREDEPSSLIAFALDGQDYKAKLEASRRQDARSPQSDSDVDEKADLMSDQSQIERTLHRETGSHLKYQFREGNATMLCKIFYAEQFDAVRKTCGVADRIVESLARCVKWDSKGGKSKSVFLKTLDDRFVLKSLQQTETQAYLKFAPAYFQIMSEVFFRELPSVIAKMLGFYQVVIKNPTTGTDIKWDLLLMENLFYDRIPSRTFDLKGSMRNRKVQPTGDQNEVLLDENMVDLIFETPLFAREHSKKLLRASVWNDTLFLGRQNVMDYSLMVAIDDVRKELVVGIIDCIRTYTWDKRIEYWIKDRGFTGGGRNMPTVTSPKEYKSRFREAMARYVLQAPNCWHQFTVPRMNAPQVLPKATAPVKESDKQEVEVKMDGM